MMINHTPIGDTLTEKNGCLEQAKTHSEHSRGTPEILTTVLATIGVVFCWFWFVRVSVTLMKYKDFCLSLPAIYKVRSNSSPVSRTKEKPL